MVNVLMFFGLQNVFETKFLQIFEITLPKRNKFSNDQISLPFVSEVPQKKKERSDKAKQLVFLNQN